MRETVRRLRHVLAGQRFPAQRWELIVCAEVYGADTLSKRELRELPATRYDTFGEVLLAVESGRRPSAMQPDLPARSTSPDLRLVPPVRCRANADAVRGAARAG